MFTLLFHSYCCSVAATAAVAVAVSFSFQFLWVTFYVIFNAIASLGDDGIWFFLPLPQEFVNRVQKQRSCFLLLPLLCVRLFVCLFACFAQLVCLYHLTHIQRLSHEPLMPSHHMCIACHLNNLHSNFHLDSFRSVWHFIMVVIVVNPYTCHDTIFLCASEFSLIRFPRGWCV